MIAYCSSETCSHRRYDMKRETWACGVDVLLLKHAEEDGYNLVCESFEEDEEKAEEKRRRARESDRFAREWDEGVAIRKGEL